MTSPAGRVRRAIVSSIAAAAALAVSGCTNSGPSQPQIPPTQPRVATYQCGEDGDVRIVNTGASVLVSQRIVPEDEAEPPEEARFELVASPPNQRSRYGAEGLALVLEGREALWMKAGSPPLTCTR